MSWVILSILAVVGIALTGFAAIALRALREFSRRELEIYSRRRKRSDRFGEILDGYEETSLGVESLKFLGAAEFLLAFYLAIVQGVGGAEQIGLVQFLAIAAVGSIVLLAMTTWIPEAVIELGTAPFLFHSWPALRLIAWGLWPFTLGGRICAGLFRRLAGQIEEDEDVEEAFEDEILSIVTEGLHDGVLEQQERAMIEGVIELGDRDVFAIMTPRSSLDAIDVHMSWEDVQAFVIKVGRTRIPVYENTLDNIVGVLYVKDLFQEFSTPESQPGKELRNLLREPWFVPTTKPLDELLQEFLRTRRHLAIVVDEYMSVAGVVTIEEVLEEIVGEIVDESDAELVEEFIPIDEQTAEVLGSIHLHVVNNRLGLDLPDSDEYDTLAGLVIAELGYIPKQGEFIQLERAVVTVLDVTRRRIERLRIELVETSSQTLDAT